MNELGVAHSFRQFNSYRTITVDNIEIGGIMDYMKDLIFDFFTLSLYAILIIVAVCIILRNTRKVYCIIYEIGDISFKGFFTTLLTLFFRQLSTIIIYSMIGTVAQLYLKRSMLFGIGFFFTKSASLLRGMGVRFPSALLILTVVISAVISIVKHLREGEIKRYMPLYVIGIVAISCVCTVALCHIMPPGIDSYIDRGAVGGKQTKKRTKGRRYAMIVIRRREGLLGGSLK